MYSDLDVFQVIAEIPTAQNFVSQVRTKFDGVLASYIPILIAICVVAFLIKGLKDA